MADFVTFVAQAVMKQQEIGAFFPSSNVLTDTMLRPINFKTAKHIVELGPGTGTMTKVLLERMAKDCRLTVIEINKSFCKKIRQIHDKRLHVIEGNARDLSSHIKKAEYVVSGLPLHNFPLAFHETILREVKKVATIAYIQFHTLPKREQLRQKYFTVTQRKHVLRNIPPSFVYVLTPR